MSERLPEPGVAHPRQFRARFANRKWLVLGPVLAFALGIAFVAVVLLYFNLTLPNLSKLKDYQPPLGTEIYAVDLQKYAEFGTERRYVVEFDEIPPLLVKAFIASEDSKFFQHEGIDYRGVARAFFKNLQAGRVVQGGSTITQQVAKSLLLSSERSFSRKIKEALLATRMEKNLSKEDILYLYLNQIYLGHGAYGVQAAARNYFNKDVQDLNLAECTLLAGLPQAPSGYSPLSSVKASKERQAYVLRRMVEDGYINEEAMKQARATPLTIYEKVDRGLDVAPDFAEYVRRLVLEKYGNKVLLEGGLQVYTTVDLEKQRMALNAVHRGLEEVDQRQGYRGVLGHLDLKDEEAVRRFAEDVHDAAASKGFFVIPSLEDVLAGRTRLDPPPEHTPFKADSRYRALVLSFDANGKAMNVQVGREKGVVRLEDMKWAREPNPEVRFDENAYYVKYPKDRFKPGDIIYVAPKTVTKEDIAKKKYDAAVSYFKLAQEPLVQGALLSMDPESGFVSAMIGGYDYRASEYNRAIQGARQPGSAFKPIIYAAALDKGYTASTIIVDSPIVYETENNKEEFTWRPKNYEGKFNGDTPFRKALIKSMNVITIKILQDIGLDYVIAYARNLGITSPINRDLSLALGSLDVSLLELTKVYAAFPRQGRTIEPVFITKILDRNGQVLERHSDQDFDVGQDEGLEWLGKRAQKKVADIRKFRALASVPDQGTSGAVHKPMSEVPPGHAISPQTAYLMTHLLTQVVQFGTAQVVKALGRPAAGKTGTTNDETDAWFIGFTPDLLTGVWVGYNQKKPLGKGETGGHAASPIWLYYMHDAVEGMPVRDFSKPPGIVFATVHKDTGYLASADTPVNKRIVCAYLEGTQPTSSEAPRSNAPPEDQMFMDSNTSLGGGTPPGGGAGGGPSDDEPPD